MAAMAAKISLNSLTTQGFPELTCPRQTARNASIASSIARVRAMRLQQRLRFGGEQPRIKKIFRLGAAIRPTPGVRVAACAELRTHSPPPFR
jgi:hypothetical protein